jgi:quercetin dioxygenase-like cupin family protein
MDWAKILEDARAVVANTHAVERLRFLSDWPAHFAPRPVTPSTLTVLKWLGVAADGAPPGAPARLARGIAVAAHALAWRQTYRAGDVPAGFLERYGWCELLGATGPVPCEALAGGLLLLGPDARYPAHRHAAEELYIPLSGRAEWQRGGGPFVARPPGEAIIHASGEPHAMRTGAEPLLALYLWRGAGLGESATLQPTAPDDCV